MKLNHLNLSVTDTKRAQAFLARYFGMSISGQPNEHICFLTDDTGMVLSLTKMAPSDLFARNGWDFGFCRPVTASLRGLGNRGGAERVLSHEHFIGRPPLSGAAQNAHG